MPLGMPKVPFRMPEDEDASWVDLYNGLYQQRNLFLFQDVGSEISNQLVSLMLYLGGEFDTRDIFLFINSSGGSVVPGLVLYDTMQCLNVSTTCVSLAASVASFILVGGKRSKRTAFPHARVMMHQPASAYCDEKTGQYTMETDELIRIRNSIITAYVDQTGQSMFAIWRNLERDSFMSATEAKDHGIVDNIG